MPARVVLKNVCLLPDVAVIIVTAPIIAQLLVGLAQLLVGLAQLTIGAEAKRLIDRASDGLGWDTKLRILKVVPQHVRLFARDLGVLAGDVLGRQPQRLALRGVPLFNGLKTAGV